MDTPVASVIINCFNGAEFLREAIDSVYAQTVSDWEIIFWDNASVDESASIAHSYDGRIRYFLSAETLPLYEARKLAVDQCRGECIGFLDCDDLWAPRKLEVQLRAFQEDPRLSLVHTNAVVLNENGHRSIRHRRQQPSGEVFRDLLRNYGICLPTVMISGAAAKEFNFDPAFYFSGDADLFMRIAHKSRIAYLHEVTAVYRVHSGAGTLRHIQRLPCENEQILLKFGTADEGFFDKYANEIVEFRMRAQLSVLMTKWRMGFRREMRSDILQYWRAVGLWLVPFLASVFPDRGVQWLRSILGRI
jgi:glycosyltransferase involved in cell wall biosynthesis